MKPLFTRPRLKMDVSRTVVEDGPLDNRAVMIAGTTGISANGGGEPENVTKVR